MVLNWKGIWVFPVLSRSIVLSSLDEGTFGSIIAGWDVAPGRRYCGGYRGSSEILDDSSMYEACCEARTFCSEACGWIEICVLHRSWSWNETYVHVKIFLKDCEYIFQDFQDHCRDTGSSSCADDSGKFTLRPARWTICHFSFLTKTFQRYLGFYAEVSSHRCQGFLYCCIHILSYFVRSRKN